MSIKCLFSTRIFVLLLFVTLALAAGVMWSGQAKADPVGDLIAAGEQQFIPAMPMLPAGSLPGEVQKAIDPIYEAGMSLIDPGYTLPPSEQYEATDPLSEQIDDTIDMFTLQTVYPDAGSCHMPNPDFDTNVACSSSIVDENNGAANVAPVNILGRYVPFVLYGVDPICGGVTPVNYCGGSINLSEPKLNEINELEPSVPQREVLTFVLAHEDGHFEDDVAARARGESIYTQDTFALEQRADKEAGRTIWAAELQGDVPPGTFERSVSIIRHTNPNDLKHGNAVQREAAMRRGAGIP